MKRNTLIKVVLLVLVSIFALTLVACTGGQDDVEKVTIYLDPNGGTLGANESDEFEVAIGESIGKLPTPTRGGYEFLGWYEDGNERWEVDRRTKAEYDMEIVALWAPKGDLVTVEFSVSEGLGEQLVGDLFVEVVKGERISTVINSMPYATRPDYKFKGWKDQNNNTITITSKIDGDMVLTPSWEQIIYCYDGTENHPWNAWQEATEATCTQDATSSRVCGICGHTEYNITQPATGHKFGNWIIAASDSGMVRSRICVECDEKEADPLENIAYGSFNTPIVDGDCWGGDKGANLFDNNYTDRSIAGKGTGALTVTINAKQATKVDLIAVTGFGAAAYNVVVFFSDGTQQDLGVGAFGSGDGATKSFDVGKYGKEVTKIVVTQPSPSNGTDYWSEIAILVVPQ